MFVEFLKFGTVDESFNLYTFFSRNEVNIFLGVGLPFELVDEVVDFVKFTIMMNDVGLFGKFFEFIVHGLDFKSNFFFFQEVLTTGFQQFILQHNQVHIFEILRFYFSRKLLVLSFCYSSLLGLFLTAVESFAPTNATRQFFLQNINLQIIKLFANRNERSDFC